MSRRLRWTNDVPPTTRGSYEREPNSDYEKVALALKAKPGKWAEAFEKDTNSAASGLAVAIRTGRYLSFRPAGSFEATTRQNVVWVRYIGR